MKKLITSKVNLKTIILVSILFFVGLATRTFLHIGPNVEFVTAISVIGFVLIGTKAYLMFLPLAIIILSDLIIGNTIIYIFTWSGFIFTGLISFVLIKLVAKARSKLSYFSTIAPGVISVVVFYLWTNFGVVVTTMMYSKDIFGLLNSYINALPFLRNQFLTTFVALSIFWFAYSYLPKLNLANREHNVSPSN